MCKAALALNSTSYYISFTDVPVWDISTQISSGIQENAINSLVIDLNVKINNDGTGMTGVSGQNLWKVSMWGSGNNDGSGERIGFVSQVRSLFEV